MSCANDRDADSFTFAHVAQRARNVLRTCVDDRAVPYGGIEELGTEESFYVSLGRPVIDGPSEVTGLNGTA